MRRKMYIELLEKKIMEQNEELNSMRKICEGKGNVI